MASQESIIMMAAASQRGLETSATTNLRKEQRTPIREDEFWLIETDIAELPFEVDFTPPDDSYGNIKPLWSCDDPNASEGRAKKLVFVNVVRTEALDVLQLLSSYASSCHAGFVSTGKEIWRCQNFSREPDNWLTICLFRSYVFGAVL